MNRIIRDFIIVMLCIAAAVAAFLFMRSFILTALFVYIMPNVWIFFHLKKIISNKVYRTAALILFVFLALAFPAGEILENAAPTAFFPFYIITGFLYLPFLLYFVMAVPVARLSLYLAGRWGITKFEGKNSILIRSSVTAAVISLIVTVAGNYNFNHPRVSDYKINLPEPDTTLTNPFRIIVASDLHIGKMTGERFLDRFIEKINETNADIVLLPGDILEGPDGSESWQSVEHKMAEIRARYGVYATSGNHEHYGSDHNEIPEFYERTGIQLLDDTAVVINNSYLLAGISDVNNDPDRTAALLEKFINDSLTSILMYHRPVNYDIISSHGVDLVVSGHTHHGQLWPFNYITRAMYELSRGYKIINGTHFFVSSGAQGWGPPVRTNSWSEIMVINF